MNIKPAMDWLTKDERNHRDDQERKYLCSLTKDELIDRWYGEHREDHLYDGYGEHRSEREIYLDAIDWAKNIRKSCQ